MFRKLAIAFAATAVIGAAAVAPTAASAAPHHGHHGWHHGWHGVFGIGFYGPAYYAGPDCYVVKRLVETPVGPRWRRVPVCD